MKTVQRKGNLDLYWKKCTCTDLGSVNNLVRRTGIILIAISINQ